MTATKYFALEMNGSRKVVRAKVSASLFDLTEQAYGFAAARQKDATVIAASSSLGTVTLEARKK